MSGKLADTVMTVRNGEQIARKYQPNVYNPSTPAQRETRAKLKLMSQLSAIMAPFVAMPRQGSISPRNRFVKKNYLLTGFSENTATVNLQSVQLTDSVIGSAPISATRTGSTISVACSRSNAGVADAMVYVLFEKQADGTLRHVDDTVVETAGDGGIFAGTLTGTRDTSALMYIYGYGIKNNTGKALPRYGNLEVPTATDIAQLVVSMGANVDALQVTETVFCQPAE